MDSPLRSFESITQTLDTSALPLSELKTVAIIGEGAFGTVRLVKHERSGTCYALKVMQKSRIMEMSQQWNVIMEKNIMLRASHPYILRLHRTYQDANSLYMLMEFCQGGDMFALLGRQGGRIESKAARHYAAVVASVLEYLHHRSVVYRDLKPENLVFDFSGHLKVVDFGFAKIVRDRTYTLCGTPEYLSPELVQGAGHHHGVDCWALGILIFEMLCGYSPFADREHNNQTVIYRNIISGRYFFPAFLEDESAKDLIRRFLVAKDVKRLGCLKGGFVDVRNHPWFDGFNWEALLNMTLPPPLVPEFTSSTDLSMFDEVKESSVSKMVPFSGDSSIWEAEF